MEKRRVRESDVMHRRVALYTGGQRYTHEGSVIVHRRVVGLCAGGQRDCIQEGSVAMAGCHSLLN